MNKKYPKSPSPPAMAQRNIACVLLRQMNTLPTHVTRCSVMTRIRTAVGISREGALALPSLPRYLPARLRRLHPPVRQPLGQETFGRLLSPFGQPIPYLSSSQTDAHTWHIQRRTLRLNWLEYKELSVATSDLNATLPAGPIE